MRRKAQARNLEISGSGANAPSRNDGRGELTRGRPRRMEHQRVAIHAIPQAGRLRAVVEDMAEMAAAAAAMHFRTPYAVGAVFRRADGVFERLVEARPTGPAFELGLGGEQRQVAAGAGKGAPAVLFQ